MADSKQIDNSGPAFPATYEPEEYFQGGMSLRDYFAGQAIARIPLRSWDHVGDDNDRIRAWAKCAYLVADAMLAAKAGA